MAFFSQLVDGPTVEFFSFAVALDDVATDALSSDTSESLLWSTSSDGFETWTFGSDDVCPITLVTQAVDETTGRLRAWAILRARTILRFADWSSRVFFACAQLWHTTKTTFGTHAWCLLNF